ncbi:AMP phosphorylase [Candidatus Woesearchaeota archaeon]|nr:MAG: AMP phosphorylase [Candidatus Woesearchaeota archaeon]
MRLKVKDMDIATGGIQVAILNEDDAHFLDLHHLDRLKIKHKGKSTIATLDIAESERAVPQGNIGLFEETLKALDVKEGDLVSIEHVPKPESVAYIREKMDGRRISSKKLRVIVEDIVQNKLSDIELTAFVVTSYTRGMNNEEIVALTKAIADTGIRLKFDHKSILDLHSIGGVPGNRTTMLIVPILVAAGCTVPKTSSRAITSPAGTADTMEVFCSVSLSIPELKRAVKKVGGFIVWGGSVNLAPADDKIINVEYPLSIDPEAQMIASIMAKKASVGATHLLIEIPVGKEAKVNNRKKALHLSRHFSRIGKALNIKVKTVITKGSEPVGKGIGPILEARDVLWALHNSERAPKDLVKKSIELSAILLEFSGKARARQGKKMAQRILKTGAALGAMMRIVEAQGGKLPNPEELKPGPAQYTAKAEKSGRITGLENKTISKIARLAGAPLDKGAGVYLHARPKSKVKKGDMIITIYAHSKRKLNYAKKELDDKLKVID